MGAEVQSQSYTREERQRYREKVRQNLDVFEKMLNTSSFEFDRPMTGLEIELNLVDARHAAALPQRARCSHAIADEDYQTELAQYNIELNVPPAPAARRLRPRARARSCARASTRADQRRQGGRLEDRRDRHPADDHARALRGRVDQPQQPLHGPERLDLRRPRRGHLPRHRGSHRGAGRHLLRLDRARVRLHLGAAAPAGGALGVRRALERRPGAVRAPGGAGRQLAVLLRQAAARRDAHRAVQAGHRHPAGRAEEPGRAASRSSSASGGSPRSSTCSRRTSGTSRRCSPRPATRTRWRSSRPASRPSCPSCGCTTAPSTAGTARSTTSSAARRTCGSRTASCRPARPSSTCSPTRPSTTARSGCSPTRTGRCGPR